MIPENKMFLLQCIYVLTKHSYCSYEEDIQKTATVEKKSLA
jgi:hypothetical protein